MGSGNGPGVHSRPLPGLSCPTLRRFLRPGAGAPGERTERVKRRIILLGSAVFVIVAAVASISVASAGTTKHQSVAALRASYPAPAVPNAAAIKKKYGGQSITFIGDSVGG